MRRVTLAPCSPFSVEASVMVETAKMARHYGVMLHTHLVETMDEEEYCLEKYGLRPLAVMEQWGWLGEDVYFAHGIWFNDEELRTLKETRDRRGPLSHLEHAPRLGHRANQGDAGAGDSRRARG